MVINYSMSAINASPLQKFQNRGVDHARENISSGMRYPIGTPLTLSTAGMTNHSKGVFDGAIRIMSKQQADLGAYFNRFEHTATELMIAYENTRASESGIRGTDRARTTVDYTKLMIQIQSRTEMRSQANAMSQLVMEFFVSGL